MKKKSIRTGIAGWLSAVVAAVVCAAVAICADRCVAAQEYANDAMVGVEPKLGETIPLDLRFNDEQGQPVTLGALIKRPTVFVLVYLRCPGICSPMMREVAGAVDQLDLEPGIDFDLITVSFDARETAELAAMAKENLLADMERTVPPESWRFLTGDELSITRLTDAFGYRFKKDKGDFAHSATIMFVSPTGKIVRYLPGLKILPSHMKMAIQDAADGRARSFMQAIQRLCYAYDPQGKTYIVKVNRIILVGTLLMLGVFAGYLFVFGRNRPAEAVVEEVAEEVRPSDGDC